MADIAEDEGLVDEQGNPLSHDEIVARRTIDTDEPTLGEHVKVFVLAGAKPTEANDYDHEPNKAATRQYAISQGMRPTGDVKVKSIKRNRDGVAWDVTYAVPVAVGDDLERPSMSDIVSDGPKPEEEAAPTEDPSGSGSDDTATE